MFKSGPSIKAARLGRVRSQSCEALDTRSVITSRNGKDYRPFQCQKDFYPACLFRRGGFFFGGLRKLESLKIRKLLYLCSEQTTGNRGTHSYGTLGDGSQNNLPASPVRRAARGNSFGGFF